MFRRLNGIVFGVLLFVSALLGSVFLLFPILILAFFSPRVYRKIADRLIAYWLTFPCSLIFFVFGVKVHVTGDLIQRNEPALIIMNHRTRLDWLFVWNALYRMDPLLLTTEKIVLKAPLKTIPGAGWCMSGNSFIFLNRSIAQDQRVIETMVKYYKDSTLNYQILLFPEGTDRGDRAVNISHAFAETNGLPKYDYVLHPRTTGFNHILNQMRKNGYIKYVYDVTVGYPNQSYTPKKWIGIDFIHGNIASWFIATWYLIMTFWTSALVKAVKYNDKSRLLHELYGLLGVIDIVSKKQPEIDAALIDLLVDGETEYYDVHYKPRTAEETKKANAAKTARHRSNMTSMEKKAAQKRRSDAKKKELTEEDNQADLEDYASLKKFTESRKFFDLTQRLQKIGVAFKLLLPEQVTHFYKLLKRLHKFVDKFAGGASKFYGRREYIWNAAEWLRILIKMCNFDVNRCEKDFCKSSLHFKNKGCRPSIRIAEKSYALAIPACVLVRGPPKSYIVKFGKHKGKRKAYDASHLCHCGICVNPKHLVFESNKKNRGRCTYPARSLCKHKPPCIATIDGVYLECCNDPDNEGKCGDKCEQDCYGYVDSESDESSGNPDLGDDEQLESDASDLDKD